LVAGGIKAENIKSRGDSLVVKGTVEAIEELFQTEMHVFVHSEIRRKILAHMGESSVPEAIKDKIDMVTALSFFPPPRHITERKRDRKNEQQQTPWLIPSHIREQYKIPADLRATNPMTTQAAVEFEWPGCFSYADIEEFQSLTGFTFTNVSRIIPEDEWVDSGCDGESALDLEMMLTIGSGTNTAYFTNEYWIYEFALTLMGLTNPPLVTSLSWGWMEADSCQIGGYACSMMGNSAFVYVNRTNIELNKAGLMGLTVLVCTQDEGAPSDNNDDCTLDDSEYPVWPIFPSSSPYVTAIGATTIYTSDVYDTRGLPRYRGGPLEPNTDLCAQIMCNNGTLEKVAMSSDMDTLFTSGGGFSNWTARPSYQAEAVKAYLSSDGLRPSDNRFGVNNRAYPDISAVGCQVLNVMGGQISWEGGTSESTPIMAGIISLLNDWRLNNGKKPLGFLNYLLYEMGSEFPQAYNDITVGNNTCTGWEMDTCCKWGYSAQAGWNPTVGFGTPNFPNILQYVQKLK